MRICKMRDNFIKMMHLIDELRLDLGFDSMKFHTEFLQPILCQANQLVLETRIEFQYFRC